MKTRKIGKYLRFKKEYVKKILEGRKTTTIRKGILSLSHDTVYLESNGKIYGRLALKSVRYTKLSNLRESDAKADGFKNLDELKNALTDIYPDIKDDDWVTIIKFQPINQLEKPLTRTSILEEDKIYKISRLVLAYDLPKTLNERRVFSLLIYYGGDIRKTIRDLDKSISFEEILNLIKKYSKILKTYGYSI
ncbi:MAG: ASCH domain-containing protein [Thermoproteales archaeon]|nr:ASCH domain-containing protein [Thermoproteales archaeon]